MNNQEAIEQEQGKDRLLAIYRDVSEMLTMSLRAMDIPFGGDKTGAILPETDVEGAINVANRLFHTTVRTLRVGVNIGIAQFPSDGVTETEIIQAADAALLVSQTAGQPYVIYSRISENTKKDQGDLGGVEPDASIPDLRS